MTFAKRQAGLGFLGWLIVVLVVGSAITVSLKLIPAYIDYQTMASDMEAMAEKPGMAANVDARIRENLKRRFSIDNIEDFDLKKNITVQRSPEHVFVTMKYQITRPLIGNVDLLVSFNKKVELKQ